MRVFVAGGAGVVGRRLVEPLVARGHRTTATTTNPRRAAELTRLGAETVVLDGLDADAVHAAVTAAPPDPVGHQMTALGGAADLKHLDRWFATTNRLRTEAPTTRWPRRVRRREPRRRAELRRLERAALRRLGQDGGESAGFVAGYGRGAGDGGDQASGGLARPLAGEVAVGMMTEGRGFSNAKARRELGWTPRYPSSRQGFRDGQS